jgi:hypothetical protein
MQVGNGRASTARQEGVEPGRIVRRHGRAPARRSPAAVDAAEGSGAAGAACRHGGLFFTGYA